MTLESIYYIGQTLAVIGILASILMVWRQLKQGQKMERAAAQRDVLWAPLGARWGGALWKSL